MLPIVRAEERPTSGTYLSMWEHDGKPWATTFQWIDGSLYRYDDNIDEWVPGLLSCGSQETYYITLRRANVKL